MPLDGHHPREVPPREARDLNRCCDGHRLRRGKLAQSVRLSVVGARSYDSWPAFLRRVSRTAAPVFRLRDAGTVKDAYHLAIEVLESYCLNSARILEVGEPDALPTSTSRRATGSACAPTMSRRGPITRQGASCRARGSCRPWRRWSGWRER